MKTDTPAVFDPFNVKRYDLTDCNVRIPYEDVVKAADYDRTLALLVEARKKTDFALDIVERYEAIASRDAREIRELRERQEKAVELLREIYNAMLLPNLAVWNATQGANFIARIDESGLLADGNKKEETR